MKEKQFDKLVYVDDTVLRMLSQHNLAEHNYRHLNCYFLRAYGRPSPNVVFQFFAGPSKYGIEAQPGTYRCKIYFVQKEYECIYSIKMFLKPNTNEDCPRMTIEWKSPDSERVKNSVYHLGTTVFQGDKRTFINIYMESVCRSK